MECLEKPINFNNSDGNFDRDKWLDFMNTKINNIGFYSAWTGHTTKIVNQQSKKIDFFKVTNLDDKDSVSSFKRQYTDFYSNPKSFYSAERWDKNKGWLKNDYFDTSFVGFMFSLNNPKDLPKERTLFKVAMDRKVHFVFYMPEFNSIRTVGYWEFAGLGFKKYLNHKVKDQLEKLGVL